MIKGVAANWQLWLVSCAGATSSRARKSATREGIAHLSIQR